MTPEQKHKYQRLSPAQQRYVDLRLQGLTMAAAARAAGYSDDRGELKSHPVIVELINAGRVNFGKQVGMTREKILEGLEEAIDLARIKGDPASMVAGWREVAKVTGHHAPKQSEIKVTHTGTVNVAQQLQKMSDDELLQLIQQPTDSLEGEFTEVQ